MWGACLSGRYNRTLPRPRRDSQAVARPSNRFSRGVLVVFVPVWFQATFRKPSTDAKTNKQITENILHGRRERLRETFGKVGAETSSGSKITHLVDPNSLNRWSIGEMSRVRPQPDFPQTVVENEGVITPAFLISWDNRYPMEAFTLCRSGDNVVRDVKCLIPSALFFITL